MFTLPVKTWEHIVSKLSISMLWAILSFLATICSILINTNIEGIKDNLIDLVNLFKNFLGTAGFFVLPVYILIMIASGIVMVYTAIALGHLVEKHRLLASFGMFCVLYFVYQTVSASFIFLFINNVFSFLTVSSKPAPHELNMFILSLGLLYAALTSVNFALTNVILKKRLNLE